MRKEEIQALGWAYGRLVRALGDSYDSDGVKFRQAGMRPLTGLTRVHSAVIKKKLMTARLERELGAVLNGVEINDMPAGEPEPAQSLENQGIWQLSYYRGKSGENFSCK